MLALDYVSPLPPVRSGIADYSVDLLPGLAARADVRLIRLPEQEVAPEVAARWPMAPSEATGEGGRLPLYQMGNNRYHEAVFHLGLRLPGVLTLHDVVLHHLLLDRTLGRGDFYACRDELERNHGWVGRAAAQVKRWNAYADAPLFSLPAHRELLARQRGVLVHSAWAEGLVREDNPGVRVRAVPMGIPLPPYADPEAGRALRERFGLPAEAPVIGSFGFQTPIKRTSVAVAALAQPGLERVHLLIVGEEAYGVDLQAEARKLGVGERVHVTGFVSFADFEAAIAATDLCLNLRYPTAGETSASLLRVLAAGRPAIVSDYAQFADLPREVAVRTPLWGALPEGESEAAALAAELGRLLVAPERLREMGLAAREHVRRHHDPDAAADAVAAACLEWRGLPPPGEPLPEALPPSSLVWNQLAGALEVAGAEAPWPPGERRRLSIRLRNDSRAVWRAGDHGPGGVAVVVKLFAGESREDLLGGRCWLPLSRDLAPEDEARFAVEVRRPPGPARLVIEPHRFGGAGFSLLGGPVWERNL